MTQTDLFDPLIRRGDSIVPPVERARHGDPETSHAAAARVTEFDANHFGRILSCLRQHGPQTFHELAYRLGLDGQQVNKRLPELERISAVHRTGDTRLSPAGRACTVWAISA
jgi:predicted transcriptional regulator